MSQLKKSSEPDSQQQIRLVQILNSGFGDKTVSHVINQLIPLRDMYDDPTIGALAQMFGPVDGGPGSRQPEDIDIPCLNLKYILNWDQNNTCYLDSVLVPIFANTNKFVLTHILTNKSKNFSQVYCDSNNATDDSKVRNDIRAILYELYQLATGKKDQKEALYCLNLQSQLPQCKRVSSTRWSEEHQDSGYFLITLFKILDVPGNVQVTTTTISEYDSGKHDVMVTNYPAIFETMTVLTEKPKWKIADLLSSIERDDKTGEVTTKQITKLTDPYIWITIERGSYENVGGTIIQKDIDTPVELSPQLTITGETLYLRAVIIYLGGHYVSYLKCKTKTGDEWFYYDDIGPVFEKVGKTVKNLEKHKGGQVLTKSRMVLYMRRFR